MTRERVMVMVLMMNVMIYLYGRIEDAELSLVPVNVGQ